MLNATQDRIKEIGGKPRRISRSLLACFRFILAGVFALCAQQEHDGLAVPVRLTVTASVVGGRSMPQVIKGDVVVRQHRDTLRVLEWEPASRVRAGLDLFILIDDAFRQGQDSGVGREMNSYRYFRGIKLREQKLVSWR